MSRVTLCTKLLLDSFAAELGVRLPTNFSADMSLSKDDLARMRDVLAAFRDQLAAFAQAYGPLPRAGSICESELKTFVRQESLHTAHSQTWILMEVIADQLTAFVKTLMEPVETIAPYTCVRSLLEAAALACWLLDPEIDAKIRVSRSLALRFEGMDQQARWAKAAGYDPARGKQRLQDVIVVAAEMGYEPVIDARGRVSGAGQHMPSVTTLIHSVLDEEPLYRLLSAVAHGHTWALQQLSFQRAPEFDIASPISGRNLSGVTKGTSGSAFALLLLVAAQSFGRAVWLQAAYFGWDVAALVDILERSFDDLGASDSFRFWRAAT